MPEHVTSASPTTDEGKPPALRGLPLQVVRPAGKDDGTNGGVSGKHARLTLVGTVERASGSRPPRITPLEEDYQTTEATPDAPPVWRVESQETPGTFVVIPSYDDGDPQLKALRHGGNFVIGLEPDVVIEFRTSYPIPVHDRLP